MNDKWRKKFIYAYAIIDLFKLSLRFSYSKKRKISVQNKNVYKIMKHCYEIPLYRQKFEQIHLMPEDFKTAEDLYKFPITTKNELRDWYERELRNNPNIKKYWMRDSTSGSTGIPMEVYYSPKDRGMNIAMWMHAAMYNGFNPITGITASISNPATIKMGNTSVRKIGILRKCAISYNESPQKMVEFFNNVKPGFFYTNKAVYVQMAIYANKTNTKLHKARICASTGEKMDNQSLELIKSVFGDVIYDTYGCTETGMLAFQKAGHNDRYMVHHDTHVVHIIDDNEKPALKGRAILTSLYHYGFPVINYDVGDGMEGFEDVDGMFYIRNINGRLNDWITFEDGTRINFLEIETVMKDKKFLQQYRFIQEDYNNLRIVLASRRECDINIELEERRLQQQLSQILGNRLKYIFEWKDEIELDKNGKLRVLISKVN